jgi:hypothetical protein
LKKTSEIAPEKEAEVICLLQKASEEKKVDFEAF